MSRIKKIKGGLNEVYLQKLTDLSSFNNLKSLDYLLLKTPDIIKKENDEYFFVDDNEDFIIRPSYET